MSPSLAAAQTPPPTFHNLNWSTLRARLAFESLLRSLDFDEEQAYNVLLVLGCPLAYADAAWNEWAMPQGARQRRVSVVVIGVQETLCDAEFDEYLKTGEVRRISPRGDLLANDEAQQVSE